MAAVASTIFDDTADWQQFTGQSRIANGVIRLAHRDTASDLGLGTGIVCNYRFGQTQSLASTVGVSNAASIETVGTGTVQFLPEGVKPYGDSAVATINSSNFAAVRLGGDSDKYTWLNDDATQPCGIIYATTISFWTNFDLTGVSYGGILFGLDHIWEDTDQYDAFETNQSVSMFGWGSDITLYVNLMSGSYGDYWANSAIFDSLEWAITDTSMHHVAIYTVWFPDTTNGNQPIAKVRLFIDGLYCGEQTASVENYGGSGVQHVLGNWPPVGPHGSRAPVLFTQSESNYDIGDGTDTPYTWGPYQLDAWQPYPGIIDEFAFANADLFLDTSGNRYTTNPPWVIQDQVFQVSRHTDPGVVGFGDAPFVMVGPVTQTINGGGINWVQAVLTDAASPWIDWSTRVQVSTRAAAASFTAGNTTLPWGNWYDTPSGQLTFVGTCGDGAYSQVRVRMYPSHDGRAITSPGIASLEAYQLHDWLDPYTLSDFSAGVPAWLDISDPTANWTVIAGNLTSAPTGGAINVADFTVILPTPTLVPLPNPLTFTADFTSNPANGGLVFGYRSATDFYYAGGHGNQWIIAHWNGTAFTTLASFSETIAAAPLTLALTFTPAITSLAVNGITKASSTATLPANGNPVLGFAGLGVPIAIGSVSLSSTQGAYQDATATDTPGILQVRNHIDLPGDIQTYTIATADLPGTIYVPGHAAPIDVAGDIFVKLQALLPGTMNVIGVATADMPGDIVVPLLAGTADLPGDIFVTRNDLFIGGFITVTQVRSIIDFPGDIVVPLIGFGGFISVYQPGTIDFPGILTVPIEHPGAVTSLSSTIPEATWQTDNTGYISWGAASYLTLPVIGYLYNLGTTPNPIPSTSWQFIAGMGTSFTVTTAAIWYFTVAAINSASQIGPATSYAIWYNHPPGAPGITSMQIDGMDTIYGRPLVSHAPPPPGHTFSWSPAIDQDAADNNILTYEIQIASQADFGMNSLTGLTSIAVSIQNISGSSANWANVTNPGTWFWRIQASDGKQSSAWSQVGSFNVNAPPNRPSSLAARAG